MKINFLVLMVLLTSFKILSFYAFNDFLYPFRNNIIYKIHPLVLITKEGKSGSVTLLQQDELDENESPVIKLKKIQNNNMMLYCSGYYNCLAKTEEDKIDVQNIPIPANCNKMEKISYSVFEKNKIYDRSCLSPMLGSISIPVPEKPCANDRGVLVQSGFLIHNKGSIFESDKKAPNPFLQLYDICFDKNTSLPIYTSHKLVKTKLLYKEIILSDMQMKTITKDLMDVVFDRASYYPKQLQFKFWKTFGKTRGKMLLKMFENRDGQALLPYRLTPAGDFFFQPIKTATFMYENSIPVFSTICDGNLKKVELLGRILAVQLNRTLIVVTGSFGLLKLKDDKNVEQVLNIVDDLPGTVPKKYWPVSEYIYKIYYDPFLKRGISFVTLNNPYIQGNDKLDPPCENILDYDSFFNSDPTAGITVCCEIKNLFQKQIDVSQDLKNFEFGPGILNLNIHDENFPTNLLLSSK